MNNPTTLAFIELLPTDVRHRQLIQTAAKVRDNATLQALNGRAGQTIHYVTNWFAYALMSRDHPRPDVVVIYAPQTRLDLILFQQSSPESEKVQIEPPGFPLDTYAFLD